MCYNAAVKNRKIDFYMIIQEQTQHAVQVQENILQSPKTVMKIFSKLSCRLPLCFR